MSDSMITHMIWQDTQEANYGALINRILNYQFNSEYRFMITAIFQIACNLLCYNITSCLEQIKPI